MNIRAEKMTNSRTKNTFYLFFNFIDFFSLFGGYTLMFLIHTYFIECLGISWLWENLSSKTWRIPETDKTDRKTLLPLEFSTDGTLTFIREKMTSVCKKSFVFPEKHFYTFNKSKQKNTRVRKYLYFVSKMNLIVVLIEEKKWYYMLEHFIWIVKGQNNLLLEVSEIL